MIEDIIDTEEITEDIIVEVHENFSLCQKITTESTPIFTMGQVNLSRTVKTTHKLNVNSKDISNLKFPATSPIKKGDTAEIFIY